MTFEVGGSSGLNNTLGNGNTRVIVTALVVDDDQDTRRTFVELLQSYGYETSVVNDGRQAIDLIQSGRHFDVIFLDMKESLDGLQTTIDLREIGVLSMIVGMDATTSMYDSRGFRASGMDIFYKKPDKETPVCRISIALLRNEIEIKKSFGENADF